MDNFDKDFERAKKWGIFVSIMGFALILILTGFGIWVVIVLLKFFGVV